MIRGVVSSLLKKSLIGSGLRVPVLRISCVFTMFETSFIVHTCTEHLTFLIRLVLLFFRDVLCDCNDHNIITWQTYFTLTQLIKWTSVIHFLTFIFACFPHSSGTDNSCTGTCFCTGTDHTTLYTLFITSQNSHIFSQKLLTMYSVFLASLLSSPKVSKNCSISFCRVALRSSAAARAFSDSTILAWTIWYQ